MGYFHLMAMLESGCSHLGFSLDLPGAIKKDQCPFLLSQAYRPQALCYFISEQFSQGKKYSDSGLLEGEREGKQY